MKKTVSLILNAAIAVIVPWAWLSMVLRGGAELLTASGLWSLRYFTVLSNLLMGLAALVMLIARLLGKVNTGVRRLHYAGAVSVGLTLLVVLAFLGPLFGYPSMFRGVNLWMHLIVPVLALVDYALLEEGPQPTFPESLLATVPMLLYGVFYLWNILTNGVEGNDFYGFTIFGLHMVPVVYLVVFLGDWAISLLLRRARKGR